MMMLDPLLKSDLDFLVAINEVDTLIEKVISQQRRVAEMDFKDPMRATEMQLLRAMQSRIKELLETSTKRVPN